MSFFQDILTSILDRSPTRVDDSDTRDLPDLCEALISAKGEVSGQKLASSILCRFESVDAGQRKRFFRLLADKYDIESDALVGAATRYRDTPTSDAFRALQEYAEPRRQELLRRLNMLPGATVRLVRMREDLLTMLVDEPDFLRIDVDFEHLFASWFNRGFLVLQRIDWNAPASLLEKIIAYEAVHEIDDWNDLRRRLQPDDRRCFAFFHPAMPNEPLIFVEVALADTSPDSIQQVLSSERGHIRAEQANTAVFYSISNCQKGLKGVSFGNFLIKQVAQDLADQLPQLRHYLTLSPVPGLVRWARHALASRTTDWEQIDRDALNTLLAVSDGSTSTREAKTRELVLPSIAQYFIEGKRADGTPIDPVARFHLGNGASLDRIVWGADQSAKGLTQSASVMVNYRYEISEIETRHHGYVANGEVHVGKSVRALMDRASRRKKPKSPAAG